MTVISSIQDVSIKLTLISTISILFYRLNNNKINFHDSERDKVDWNETLEYSILRSNRRWCSFAKNKIS